MRLHVLEIMSVTSLVAGLGFLLQALQYVQDRNYVASVLLALIGVSVMNIAGYLARLALSDSR